MWFSLVKISWKILLSYSFVQGRISKISWNQAISRKITSLNTIKPNTVESVSFGACLWCVSLCFVLLRFVLRTIHSIISINHLLFSLMYWYMDCVVLKCFDFVYVVDNEIHFDWLIDWLIDKLIDRSIDWLMFSNMKHITPLRFALPL